MGSKVASLVSQAPGVDSRCLLLSTHTGVDGFYRGSVTNYLGTCGPLSFPICKGAHDSTNQAHGTLLPWTLIAAWGLSALLGRGSLVQEDKGHLEAEHCPCAGPP